MLCFIEARWRI